MHAVVQRQVLGDLSYAEALHAGRIGLWRAILGYDPQRGAAFCTYAWTCIQRRIWQAVKRANPFSQAPAGAVVSPSVWELAPAVVWEATTVRSALYDLVDRLPARLRYNIVTYYGLAETPPASYRQIGLALGLSHERVRQLHTEALVWLRHPARSYLLRSLLNRHTLTDYEGADAQAQRWLRRRGGRHGR